MLSNIFLDFLNRDSRQIYGLFNNAPNREAHIGLLTEALNVAVFLCAEYCVVPPGFIAECDIAHEAISRRNEYRKERLIRTPLREDTFDEFWIKKEKEYAPFESLYSGLYDEQVRSFLKQYPQSLMKRSSRVANEIVTSWEQGPDVERIWNPIREELGRNKLKSIIRIPRQIHDEGAAVTWAAINSRIKDNINIDRRLLRYALQHHYFSIYMREFGLRLITGLPFAIVDFLLEGDDLCYDYEALMSALKPLGLWNIVCNMSAVSLLSLRVKPGYLKFRLLFHEIAIKCSSKTEIGNIFTLSISDLKPVMDRTKLIDIYSFMDLISIPEGLKLTMEEIEAVDERLNGVATILTKEPIKYSSPSAFSKMIPVSLMPTVAIFVALDMEREILIKRWKLTNVYEFKKNVWTGYFKGARIMLYSPDEMGRVSAAIATNNYISFRGKPDILIVAGICGGFEGEDVGLGDIIIATSVIDLALRKVIDGEKGIEPQFRMKEFRTNKRVIDFLKSGSFDKSKWEVEVVDMASWPPGRRPKINLGFLASVDEVVSSEQRVEELRRAWPKLLGVEMESAGVCAAAEDIDMKVVVIRGVSDFANPATKSDNEWRKRAMDTATYLLETIDYNLILQ